MAKRKSRISQYPKHCNALFRRLYDKPEYRAVNEKIYKIHSEITNENPIIIPLLDRLLSLTALKEYIENEAFFVLGFKIGRKK